jgi:hypothetical protein
MFDWVSLSQFSSVQFLFLLALHHLSKYSLATSCKCVPSELLAGPPLKKRLSTTVQVGKINLLFNLGQGGPQGKPELALLEPLRKLQTKLKAKLFVKQGKAR